MSEPSSEMNPQILVNGEHQEHQEQQEQQQGDISAAGEQTHQGDGCLEDRVPAEKDKQAKMQSVLQQVRERIRSQVGTKAPRSSILELVQRIRDSEMMVQGNSGAEGGDDSTEEKTETVQSKEEMDMKEVELFVVFEEKLEVREKALREEFSVQISQVRKEMKEYTEQTLTKLQCRHHNPLKDQQESRDRKQKSAAAPTLASRRGRVLTRTMTTIIPKTCAPVIIGPRAKSETLSSSNSKTLLRDPGPLQPGQRPCQSRRPLPPACPPLLQRKKQVQSKK